MRSGLFKNSVLAMILVLASNFAGAAEASQINPATKIAEDNILALNKAMMPIYESELVKFQANFLQTHPVIIARFTGEGGHLTLYRPGQPPLEASPPPLKYQLAKSVGHSAMITYEMSAPYLYTSATDSSWKPQMLAFQKKVANAINTLNDVDIPASDKATLSAVLTIISDYLTKCILQNKVDKASLDVYSKAVRPYLPKLIKISATAQAQHQMAVIDGWKKILGKEWKNTYALTNTMLVTRQNNLLFSMLAEFMGKSAINHRLFLFETTTFTTTDENLLNLLARMISDRGLASEVLGDYYAMDSELLSNGGRQIIINEAKKYNLPAILPGEEPFDSTDWPWRHNPRSGTGPADLSQVK